MCLKRWFASSNKSSASILPLEYDEYDSQPIEIVVVKSNTPVTSPRNSYSGFAWNTTVNPCLYQTGESMSVCLSNTIMNHRNRPGSFEERRDELTRIQNARRRIQYNQYRFEFEDDSTVGSSDEEPDDHEEPYVRIPPRAAVYAEWCKEGTP